MGFTESCEIAPKVGSVSDRYYDPLGACQDGVLWVYGFQNGWPEVYVESRTC